MPSLFLTQNESANTSGLFTFCQFIFVMKIKGLTQTAVRQYMHFNLLQKGQASEFLKPALICVVLESYT